MIHRKGLLMLAGLGVIGMLFVGQSMSQPQDGDAPAPGTSAGGRGGFDPNRMRQGMLDRMKETLGAADDEWKVISPKLEKVIALNMESRFGGMRGMMGGRNRGGSSTSRPAPESETGKASLALSTLLEKKDSKPEEIKAALTAVREARAKAKAELEKAQKDLKEVLTLRQEALLVQMSMLE